MHQFAAQDEIKVFCGNAHPALARSVCDYLGLPLGKMEVFEFSNENIFVRILENVRERDVFLIQPTSSPVNKNLVELLIMIDAFKRASAERITAVVPYYGYARTDKKDQPRVPITARLIADLLTTAGASRILTVDLHAAQIQGFFNIPVDELTALFLLSDYWKSKKLQDLVVVATDIGISKRARDLAEKLNAPLAIIEKRRVGNGDTTETLNIIAVMPCSGREPGKFIPAVLTLFSLAPPLNGSRSQALRKWWLPIQYLLTGRKKMLKLLYCQ